MPHTAWTPERLLRYADEWVGVPPEAVEVRTPEYHLVAYPERMAIPTQVSWCRSQRSPEELVAEVVAMVRAWRRPDVSFWTSERTTPVTLEEYLRGQGAEHAETVDILAADLGHTSVGGPAPAGLTVRVVDDLGMARAAALVAGEVWGQAASDEDLLRELAEETSATGELTRRRVVAYVDGEPAATACLTVDAEAGVARLWGGATRPALRGRGAYRATLVERLRLARELGASTAVVKGVADTSGPILRAAGFTTYGSSRRYRLALPPA